ncbi:unnamed protein product [Camellia sinensis]
MGTTSSALVMLFALFFIERLEFICSSTNSNVSCIASEREALMKFKGNLTDEANRLSSWVGKDCCTWKGVGCSNKTGHVVKLDLRNPIPMPFGLLTADNYDPNFEMNKLGGNDGLCGAPLNSCIDDGDHKHLDESKVADETDLLWFYTGIGPGFLFGFLGVCGTLNFKKSWRYAYFQFIENNYNWISINIAIKFAQLRRKFNKGKFGG